MDYIKALNQFISSNTANEGGQKMERWDADGNGTKETVKEKKINRQEAKNKIHMEGDNAKTTYTTGSSSFNTIFFLLYTASRCFSFHQVIFRPVKTKRQNKKKRHKNGISGEWRLHHSDSLQTSVTYNLPWQSHINTNLCWQGTVLKQTKLPFQTVTRMYRQKPLFFQEGWTFLGVSECLNRVFKSLSVWYLGPMLVRTLY